ncbi:glycosyl hydrolase family 28-related protein [Paenibacillus sp. GYB004]|uniref:glycosyl hydrolase family 28-related protein n=1 Tax=Paenibacillus sp. GYB004 TaxID=2994393 RepID=UPI002F96A5DD
MSDMDVAAMAMAISAKMGQVSVKDFGAKGDKATDDARAIQAAIDNIAENGGGDIVVPPGDYTVGATIRIKPKVHLKLSNGTIIRPKSDINVVQLSKDAKISGGRIDTNNLAEFTKGCIYLDGADRFAMDHNTSISGIILYGKKVRKSGKAIHFLADGTGNNVCWVHVKDVVISYFDKGIHLQAIKNYESDVTFVNGNQFSQIGLNGNNYDIYVEGVQGTTNTSGGIVESSGNMFSDIQSEPAKNTTHFYLSCSYNRITSKCWDLKVIESGVAGQFAPLSRQNIVSSNIGTGYIIDQGTNNRIDAIYDAQANLNEWIHGVIPPSVVDGKLFVGNQDDYLAFANKRFTVSVSGPSLIGGQISNIFDLNGDLSAKWNGDTATKENPIVVEILFPSAITYFSNLGIMFGPWNESATAIKIEAKARGTWSVVKNNENLTAPREIFIHNTFPFYTEGIRIIMSGSANSVSKILRVVRIFGQSSTYSGAAYLQTGGGKMYGNLDMGNYYLRIGNTNSLPVASEGNRGQTIIVRGGAGVSDIAYICVKTETDVYRWKKINLTD